MSCSRTRLSQASVKILHANPFMCVLAIPSQALASHSDKSEQKLMLPTWSLKLQTPHSTRGTRGNSACCSLKVFSCEGISCAGPAGFGKHLDLDPAQSPVYKQPLQTQSWSLVALVWHQPVLLSWENWRRIQAACRVQAVLVTAMPQLAQLLLEV